MNRWLRNMLLGQNHIPAYPLYKRALLVGYLCVFSICIAGFYTVVILLRGRYPSWLYAVIFAGSLFALYINRKGHHSLAIVIQLLIINGAVYYFSLLSANRAGTYLFFIAGALGAFAFFSYREKYKAVLLILLGAVLFLSSYFGWPFSHKTENVNTFLVINFLSVYLVSAFIMYLTLGLDYHSQRVVREQNEALQKANRELDRFVYSVSHDLRAPLSSITGLLYLADRTDDPQELKDYTRRMKTSITALENFIGEVTDYARNARLELVLEPVDIHNFTHEVLEELKYALTEDERIVEVDVPPDKTLVTDRARLRVVLHNIIGNAIKYKHPGRPLHLTIRYTEEEGYAVLSVSDNGIGISAEWLPRVFDMFFRASEQSKGSGLGLYIAREVVTRLGGEIAARSDEGVGSRFTVRIPFRPLA